MGNYRDQLVEERKWRLEHKAKVLNKLASKKTFKSFTQAINSIGEDTKEIVKIDRILKDGVNWQ